MRTPNMLRISDATSLAIHSMWILAGNRKELVSTDTMTKLMGASKNHLSKVLQRLAHAGMIDATRGPSGGFALAGDPAKISLMDIYIAMEGPLHLKGCLLGRDECSAPNCVMGDLVKEVNDSFVKYFSNTTLADLVEGTNQTSEESL